MRRSCRLLTALLLSTLVAACAGYENRTGVDNRWRDVDAGRFVPGETTRAEVLDLLGPPSQLVNLGDGTVLYYLNEHETARGFVLIVFNALRQRTTFDRAIFFFDDANILTEYALSEETNPPVGRSAS